MDEKINTNSNYSVPESVICLQISCRIVVYTRWQHLRNTSLCSTDDEFLNHLLNLEDERRKICLPSQDGGDRKSDPLWHDSTTAAENSDIVSLPQIPVKVELASDSESNDPDTEGKTLSQRSGHVRAPNQPTLQKTSSRNHNTEDFTDDDDDFDMRSSDDDDEEEYTPAPKSRKRPIKKPTTAKRAKKTNTKVESNEDCTSGIGESDSSGMKYTLIKNEDDSSDADLSERSRSAESEFKKPRRHKRKKKPESSNQEKRLPPFERYREYLEIVYDGIDETDKSEAPEIKIKSDNDHPTDEAEQNIENAPNETSLAKRQSFRCRICGTTFPTQKGIFQHIKYHTETGKFKCHYCDRMFFGPALRDAHELVHNKQRPLVCEFCGATFNNKYTLRDHRHLHTGEKPYSCNICGQKFTHKCKRNSHEKAHTVTFQCDWCGKVLSSLCKLNIHTQKHTGNFKHTCSTCGQGFAKLDHLTRHIRIHTGEKPFVCNICVRPFRTPEMLKGHLKTQTHMKNAAKL